MVAVNKDFLDYESGSSDGKGAKGKCGFKFDLQKFLFLHSQDIKRIFHEGMSFSVGNLGVGKRP